jgi:hypothetical protein
MEEAIGSSRTHLLVNTFFYSESDSVTRSNEGIRCGSTGTASRPSGATARLSDSCLVCATETLHGLAFEKWGYSILRCEGCGLGWTKVGRDFAAHELYGRGYFEGEARDGYADYVGSE